jgi:hypothetical protein
VSAPNVAQVSDTNPTKGRLQALAAGGATVSATYQGVSGADQVIVTAAALTQIAVSPASAKIAVGALQQFTALGTFADGTQFDVTDFVTWFSTAPSVAAISNAAGSRGQAKGLAPGATTVSAVRGNVTGTAALTVQ